MSRYARRPRLAGNPVTTRQRRLLQPADFLHQLVLGVLKLLHSCRIRRTARLLLFDLPIELVELSAGLLQRRILCAAPLLSLSKLLMQLCLVALHLVDAPLQRRKIRLRSRGNPLLLNRFLPRRDIPALLCRKRVLQRPGTLTIAAADTAADTGEKIGSRRITLRGGAAAERQYQHQNRRAHHAPAKACTMLL